MEDRAYLLLEYMVTEGFNPNNYNKILELLQSAPDSISKYLAKYNQFLLSKNVIYPQLEDYAIEGAYGYLTEEGIFVPKTLENDRHFLEEAPKVPYKRHSYSYPQIDEFDVTIFLENLVTFRTLDAIIYSSKLIKDNYFGFVLDNSEDQLKNIDLINRCFNIVRNNSANSDYELAHETLSREDKQIYLIKKKK